MTKKAIIWISVSVVLIGGSVATYLWLSNRPEQNGDENNLDNKDYSDSGSGTGSTGSGSGNISSGGSVGSGSGAGNSGSGVGELNTSNFDKAKKFFGSQARFLGDRIEVKKTEKDFSKNWGLGTKEIKIVYYNNGRFFISIEGVGNNLISGNYLNGAEKLQVTSANGKWSGNTGLIVEGNPLSNIKQILSA